MATEDSQQSSHDHPDGDPVPDEVHENSWSANLELEQHANDRDRVVSDARRAIERTAGGYHVNLVTHGECGHPESYLFEALEERGVEYEFVQQCGCGGYVTRVHVE